MQSDKNAHQSQLPSLEEGPMKSQGMQDATYFNEVKRTFSYPKCLDVIKVLLYLELILFVVWIGGLFIANIHLNHSNEVDDSPYDQLKTTYELHTVNSESPSSDYVATFAKDSDDIFSTERSRTSATSVTSVTTDRNDLAETEAAKVSSESDTKGSDSDILFWGSFENLDIAEINDETGQDDEGKKGTVSDKTEPDLPNRTIAPNDGGEDFLNSGLIHVIDDGTSDVKVENIIKANPEGNVGVSFPIPPWLQQETVAATEDASDQVDNSNKNLEVHSTEMTRFDENMGRPPLVFPKFGILFFLNMTLDNDKSQLEDVDSDLDENISLENDMIEKDSTTSSSQVETQQPEKRISLWDLLRVMNIPKITFDIKYGSVEDKDKSDTSKSGSPVDEIGITESSVSSPSSLLDMADATVDAADYYYDADDMSTSQMDRDSLSQDPSIVHEVLDLEETEKWEEDFPPWYWLFQLSMPSSIDEVKDNNVEEKERSDESTSVWLQGDTVPTDDVEVSEPTLTNSDSVQSIDNQLFEQTTNVPLPLSLWLDKNKTTVAVNSKVEDDSSSDTSEVQSTERTSIEDFDNSPPILPIPDMTYAFAYDDYDLRDAVYPPLSWTKIIMNSQETFGDDISNKKSPIYDFEPDVPIEDDNLYEDLYEDYLNGSF